MLAFAGVYALFVGTETGRELDGDVLVAMQVESRWLFDAADRILHAVTLLTVGLAGCAVVGWAWRRRGRERAGQVVVALLGIAVSALVFERGLGQLDPLGGESLRTLGEGFYPSGHAAAVAGLALAVVAVSQGRARPVAWLLALGADVLLGAIIVGLYSHHASDVIGAWLLALAWWLPNIRPAVGSAPLG
ncbi:MAG TPA: phosphatase PAP2 family protein [Solirubrobacteraceae bacterium]|nr:phosphatase PAP2 family protein [Solirubrobacteraceae bacterium]